METTKPKQRRTKHTPGAAPAAGNLAALANERKILYGAPVARRNNAKTLRLLRAVSERSRLTTPGLAVIHLGDNADDAIYRIEIDKQAARIGIPVDVHGLDASAQSSEVAKLIADLNKRPDISGILVQTMHDKRLRRVAKECTLFRSGRTS